MDKVRVLVVDDEGVVIMVLENYLRSMGYEVVGRATSGDEAIDIARRLRPDAILMDIVMPGTLDGIDAAKIIKTELDIPVIFLTAYAEDQYIERAKAAEPFGYIVKPFREREIKAALEITLHRKDIERRLYKLEEIYRSMVDNVNEAIVSADSHGNIISWNQAAETMFGYLACEAVGKPITLIWPEGVRQAYQEGMGGLLSTGKSKFIGKTLESTGLRRGGGEFPLEFTPMAIKIKEGIFFTVVARDITKRKLTEDQLRNSHEQSQAFCTHLQSVEDEGKAKIASLIHDELGQNLIALGLNLNIIREQMAKKPSDVAFSRLEESLELVMRMIESARNLMAELRPPVLDDFGLMAGLEWFRDRFSSRMVMKRNG